ncbi:1-phosphofructokinase [Isobaculum melis]|uniref:Tagatose-6-phosphate kinase n=1 Tax=Isobaculum melis TaxID=142588 RepID=A0A1H9TVS0_9LACT|nr:1-phosphofructokinase [Isobaculum melis]SES01131.1 fructose-1-phosphate kinase [Isobaculum melis]
MIYTVTLNPSIDYIVQLKSVALGEINRMDSDLKLPGGKGINVSRVLNQLGQKTTTLGLIGGFTGHFIEEWLIKEGIQTDFIPVKEDTRINIKLKAGVETEINGLGPAVTSEEAEQLLAQLTHLTSEDVVILSGSKPPSLPQDYYMQMIQFIKQSGAEFVIDTTGDDLMQALSAEPLLVKPNHHELADLFQVTFQSIDEMIPYGKELLKRGAKHALISMAGDGALFFHGEDVYTSTVPTGTVKNSVGAGDSMIAGFTATYTTTKNSLKAFQMGVATGSATAFSDDLATKNQIMQLVDEVEITKLSSNI